MFGIDIKIRIIIKINNFYKLNVVPDESVIPHSLNINISIQFRYQLTHLLSSNKFIFY